MPNILLKILILSLFCCELFAAQIAITFDDFLYGNSNLFTAEQASKKILATLQKNKIKSAVFVIGKTIDDDKSALKVLSAWDKEGHIIANHSYSHDDYNEKEATFETYSADILKAHELLKSFKNFHKLFRFPFLHEGNTKDKRDKILSFLKDQGYKNAYVTIDTGDWDISDRLDKELSINPKIDLQKYKKIYLNHIWKRAQFYNLLSEKVLGREVKHTLLLHNNLINALFLDDLIQLFRQNGWKVINAEEAFQDPVFNMQHKTITSNNGLLWALAIDAGKKKLLDESEL
jgi:peptidoglycan-N-acetylglucosamine deacetylase